MILIVMCAAMVEIVPVKQKIKRFNGINLDRFNHFDLQVQVSELKGSGLTTQEGIRCAVSGEDAAFTLCPALQPLTFYL